MPTKKKAKQKPLAKRDRATKSKVGPKPSVAAAPAKPKETVTIMAAKGRPMLNWVGKRPLRHVTAFPAQHVETFDPTNELVNRKSQSVNSPGLLFHGDNKEVLAHLLANGFRGQVNMIYIDPPYDSGADYVRKVSLRGPKGNAKLDGENYTLGEQIQYTDIWTNDNYLQFMFERLMLLKELLADKGSIFLHCDWRMVHRLRCVLDEVFGSDNFINEIAWKHTVLGSTHGRRLGKAHETILWYGRSQDYALNENAKTVRVPFGEYIKKTLRKDEQGRWFYTRGRMSRQPSAQELSNKAHTITYVDSPDAGTLVSDLWDDMPAYRVYGDEDAEYPTQKNESLIERLTDLASSPGGLVLDCFLGAGTTAAVAQKLGRRWIGCDINKGAIQTTTKRLQTIVTEQIAAAKEAGKQKDLISDGKEKPTSAAQLAFTVHRVNDYDLAIQHNEAVNLACEHIGITRTRGDSFFDGTIGQRLAKIIPFGHPLSLPDLEDLKRELESRRDEERDVVVVCLGKELSVDGWLADWNRLRKRGDVPNKIEVIELRSDPKYGKFIVHQRAQAKVNIARKGDKLLVEIADFISPSILERLQQQAGLLKPKIDNWRAMVDCVMIDPAYDGKVFNIALADVPERKTDFVQGKYELPAPKGKTTVAVKITDMLGEEVLVTKEV